LLGKDARKGTTERDPHRRRALQQAQCTIAGCEARREEAEFTFDHILDRLTGSDPSVTDQVIAMGIRQSFPIYGLQHNWPTTKE
jgi:hypothetical protein